MKKIYAIISIVVSGVAFVFYGCNGFEPYTPKSGDNSHFKNMPAEFNNIGIQHNLGVEYAFEKIREASAITTRSNPGAKLTEENLNEIAFNAVLDFCSRNDYFGVEKTLCVNQINKISTNRGLTRSNESSGDIVYSDELQNFLNKLSEVMDRAPRRGTAKCKADIEGLLKAANNSLNEIDILGFYAAASTAYNSYVYWEENSVKWLIALNFPELLDLYTDEELNSFDFKDVRPATRGWWEDAWNSVGETWDAISSSTADWWNNGGGKEVVAADGGGAVAGALDGAMGGSAGGPVGAGIGAIAGSITVGSSVSIIEAISQWIR